MFVQVVVPGDDLIDEYLIEADCYYQPEEKPDYDGGMMCYPGCDESAEIEDYSVFDNATLEPVNHVLTDYEAETIEIECIRKIKEGEV
jgi:hypothetical protein